VFGGLLPVYGDRASLRRLLDQYLGDDQQRNELVDQLGGVVEAEHTYERRARQLLDLGEAAIGRPRVAVKIGAPDSDRKHQWGDFHFATSLVRSLRTHGFAGRVDLLPDWDAPDRQDADVVIHLRGLSVYEPKPSAINVMWLISHPDEVTPEECDRYDLVCVASKSLAEELRHVIETPVLYLPQATDASRFGQAKRDASLATEVLFVGNSRNQDRPVVRWAVENRLPLSVYGDGWEGRIPRRYWKGQYFPNERLPDLYASAAIVLNDHWPDMRREGIVSNRILDALAAGALVLSDPVAGLDDLVGDAVPTFSSPEELARLVHEVLADPDVRHERVDKGRRCVLDRHTFAERAATLVEAIKPLLAGRSSDCEGSRLDLESWAGHGGHPRALDSP
jgi:spore maturation protein CgeB